MTLEQLAKRQLEINKSLSMLIDKIRDNVKYITGKDNYSDSIMESIEANGAIEQIYNMQDNSEHLCGVINSYISILEQHTYTLAEIHYQKVN